MKTLKKKKSKKFKEMEMKAGIADIMEVYGDYKEFVDIAFQYLDELKPKYIYSTLDSSS